MKKEYLDIASQVLKEQLKYDDFLKELSKNPDDFVALRQNEFDDYSTLLVRRCVEIMSSARNRKDKNLEQAVLDHFDIR